MTVFAGMSRAQTSSINQNDEGGDVRWLLVFLALPATWWRVSFKAPSSLGRVKVLLPTPELNCPTCSYSLAHGSPYYLGLCLRDIM